MLFFLLFKNFLYCFDFFLLLHFFLLYKNFACVFIFLLFLLFFFFFFSCHQCHCSSECCCCAYRACDREVDSAIAAASCPAWCWCWWRWFRLFLLCDVYGEVVLRCYRLVVIAVLLPAIGWRLQCEFDFEFRWQAVCLVARLFKR